MEMSVQGIVSWAGRVLVVPASFAFFEKILFRKIADKV